MWFSGAARMFGRSAARCSRSADGRPAFTFKVTGLAYEMLRELPGPLQAIIDPLKPGQITQPVQADASTVMLLMVC